MIDEIQVENLALIKHAVLEPSSHLTVLTGETGAGKTALLAALKLLMGARADKTMVRDGASSLEAAGRFFFQDESSEEDREVVVHRSLSAEGRSRASINGSMASISELSEVIGPEIDLCSQFEHQELTRPASHVRMLDTWVGPDATKALKTYQAALDQAKETRAALEHIKEVQAATDARIQDARFVLEQIDKVNPQEGELDAIKQRLNRAEHAESLARAADEAYEILAKEEGMLDSFYQLRSNLETIAGFDSGLDTTLESLENAGFTLEDLAHQMRSYRDQIDFDPESLAQDQERLSELQGLLRHYGPTMDEVFKHYEEAAEIVALVDDAAEKIAEATCAVEKAEQELLAAADELDKVRQEGGPQFTEEVSKQMQVLEMGSAELVCHFSRLDREAWTHNGPSSLEFLYRPAKGMQARPLARIASGGEMSRVMLAIKVVLGKADYVETLVFDEIDTGVGGSVALALADLLARLAETHQVIVVTHLAQVAVRADTHYLVSRNQDEVPETQLNKISGADRVNEIARMLSGDESDLARAHAREMLGYTD
ncbi:MAG: DNA repair protein RecN [Eggerthellaceae bacterium]|jgi:DNA repair protein RecN (Recombination protein N)